MEEIREAAVAHYANLSQNEKQKVRELFNSVDADADGSISAEEFDKFLSSKGLRLALNSRIFKELDKDENGTLDFEEFLTFFFIRLSDRLLFCDGVGCGKFLTGIYFTCSQCSTAKSCFDLCCNCYRTQNFKHHSDARFLDNFARRALSPSQAKQGIEAFVFAGDFLSTVIDLAGNGCGNM